MSFAVVGYFAFLLIGLVIYYLIPRKFSWIWLLMLSYIYYFTFNIRTSLYMVSTTLFIYLGGLALDKVIVKGNTYLKENKEQLSKEEKKASRRRVKIHPARTAPTVFRLLITDKLLSGGNVCLNT